MSPPGVLFALTAICVLLNGLDDLFIDSVYWPLFFRRRKLRRKAGPLTEKALRSSTQKRVAIMIPAWHEAEVIGAMLKHTLSVVDYDRYDIFVGTYPNDDATNQAVDACEGGRVHRVVCSRPGPTSKSDCLNHVVEGIWAFERDTGAQFDLFLLHDAEDVVHPLSLLLLNHLVPRFPMVQLPVIPIHQPVWKLTAGTYLDEFAQAHLKDLLVRERLTGMVPGAGVGSAYSRQAIEGLRQAHAGEIFNRATYTEDYDLSFRINRLKLRSIIGQFFVEGPRGRELVATRECFPDRPAPAVRQKARWALGIVFHGWRELGWHGSPALRYMLWRDRKVLLTHFVDALGYGLLLLLAIGALRLPRPASWLRDILVLDAGILLNRFLERALAVYRIAGLWQALWSAIRMPWGSLLNCAAVARATWLFAAGLLTGRQAAWAKTDHVFPVT